MPEQLMEQVIHTVLTGDARKNALEFVAHLRANDLLLERVEDGYWKDKPYWRIQYKDASVCFVFIHGSPARYPGEPEGWMIWTDDSGSDWFADEPLDASLRETAWEHVDFCGQCTPDGPCAGGSRKTIFGKAFDHVCRTPMLFLNPDRKALDCVKKLVEIRKADILSNACRS